MRLKYISWIPAVIIMGIIFYFSSRPVIHSNESSLTIANSILSVYVNITDLQLQEEVRVETLGAINHFVRKSAHFIEYAILAAAITFHLWIWKRKGIWLLLIPMVLTAFYATTDEFHQTFIPGRAGQIRDVLLDTVGGATGTLLFCLIVAVTARRVKRHKEMVTAPH